MIVLFTFEDVLLQRFGGLLHYLTLWSVSPKSRNEKKTRRNPKIKKEEKFEEKPIEPSPGRIGTVLRHVSAGNVVGNRRRIRLQGQASPQPNSILTTRFHLTDFFCPNPLFFVKPFSLMVSDDEVRRLRVDGHRRRRESGRRRLHRLRKRPGVIHHCVR